MELIFWVVVGCFLGILTGLVPGLHANTVSVLAVSFSEEQSPNIALMIVSMAIVQSFVDFVPSILLGAPDNNSFLSVLPGHRMLARGKAAKAIKLTVLGAFSAGIVSLIIAPIFFLFFSKTIGIIARIVPIALIAVLLGMVLTEKNKAWAISVIVFSALLGIIVLEKTSINEPLFPLITGFFGTSSLIQSILSKNKTVKQETGNNVFSFQKIAFGSVLGVISGMIVAVLPSIGASQAAFITKSLAGKIRTTTYLVVLGAINTANIIFAFFSLFAIGKTRSGTAAAVKQVVETSPETLAFLIATIVVAIGFGAIATMFISEIAVKKIEKINYKKINIFVLVFLVLLAFIVSGVIGLIALISATAIGLTAIFSGTRRTNCMSFLIFPTLLFYLHQYYIL